MFRMIFILAMTVMVVAQEPHAVSESFDPTEEISEDYSIEFPVDI